MHDGRSNLEGEKNEQTSSRDKKKTTTITTDKKKHPRLFKPREEI